MKTNLCPARSLRPSLALLLALLALIPAAQAQDSDDSDLDLETPELYGLDKSETM